MAANVSSVRILEESQYEYEESSFEIFPSSIYWPILAQRSISTPP